ncbi:MAG: thioredoxin domain-containing protein [Acidobacteriota bacterium]|nr:thioredoxin domain-containing protein [Acidobacteriota bacterium]
MTISPRRAALRLALAAAALLLPAAAHAQYAVPPNTGNTFRDTSILKPPAGSKVAIIEFEDLECPACAHSAPIVRAAVEHYKLPYLRHDFPLKMHIWSRDAAIYARYMQDKIDPKMAEDYRRAVFAAQINISTKDDMQRFTQRFFQQHGKQMPFMVDPAIVAEVQADYNLGERVGLSQTPTIWVVTPHSWTQVTDVSLLYSTIDTALSQTVGPAPTSHLKRTSTTKK